MAYRVEDDRTPAKVIDHKAGKVGDVGRVVTPGHYRGHIVLKVYGRWVSLNDPSSTWEDGTSWSVLRDIELLSPGERVILEVQ